MRKDLWSDGFRGVGKNSLIKWHAGICYVDPVCRNRQVHWPLSAQTVCPRDPRKPSGQGRIAMGKNPRRKIVAVRHFQATFKTGVSIAKAKGLLVEGTPLVKTGNRKGIVVKWVLQQTRTNSHIIWADHSKSLSHLIRIGFDGGCDNLCFGFGG